MAINAVSSVTGLTGSTQSSGATGNALGLTSADFLNLLVKQLQNQDPFNPTDNNDFLTQTSELSTVSALTQLNTNIGQLLSLQQVSEGASLIGKKVSYEKAGATQSGVVGAVNIVNGKVQLAVGSDTPALDQVTGIKAA